MPKTLADGRIKLTILTTEPTDLRAISATVLNAGIDASCKILKSDYRLSATASDTIDETELCNDSNAVNYGRSNYEGSVTPFWYLDADGKPEALENVVYEALREKGSRVWLVEREGPEYSEDWAALDEYEVFEVVTDTPQKPSDRTGYSKRVIPLGVQRAVLDGVVAAGA